MATTGMTTPAIRDKAMRVIRGVSARPGSPSGIAASLSDDESVQMVVYTDQEGDSDRPATPWYSMTLSGLRWIETESAPVRPAVYARPLSSPR